jgi:peptide/nickel transport system substrate-binding protein
MRTICLLLSLVIVAPAWAQKDTLVVDMPADVATMDPHLQWDTESYAVYRNIFDNLITRDVSGKIVPQVAAAWHYADPLTLVFDLRTDIAFQDGSKLTAEDVAFSVRRITNPEFKSPQLSQFDQIASAEITGPAQVTLHTKTPYPVLLAQLVKLSIVPKAYVEKLGDQKFNQEPMGSGPYRLRTWQRGVQSVADANDAYWRGKPPFRSVIFRAVPDTSTRIADLRAGRADITRGLSPDDAVALKSESALKVLAVAAERIAYLFINPQAGPTKDKRIRQAIAMAVDRDTIISALQQGFAKPVNIVLPPVDFGYVEDIKPWPYDPARARALVKEAGAEGATIPFLTEAVQQMLGEIGLKVEITMVDQPTYLRRRQGTPEEAGSLSQGRWSCACQDADGVIWPLFHTGSIWSKFSNAEFDAETDAARSTLDDAERLKHYHRAFEILREELPLTCDELGA